MRGSENPALVGNSTSKSAADVQKSALVEIEKYDPTVPSEVEACKT